MREKNEDRNMYEILYNRNKKKNKKLKDDVRLTYYSFLNVLYYPEVIHLIIFSILYICSTGMNVEMAHPYAT